MCRLFGAVSDRPINVENPILKGINPFIDLSHKHSDGWGVAYVDNCAAENMRVTKSANPAHDEERFVDVIERLVSPLIIVHLRAAKNGEVALRNTHPFYAQGWVFAHNGSIERYTEMEEELPGAVYSGETDSERYFYFVLRHIREKGDVRAGIKSALAWLAERGIDGGKNFLLSDGKRIYAYRNGRELFYLIRKHDAAEGTGNGDEPASRSRAKTIIIASEPLTDESWVEVPEDQLIIVDERHEMTIEPVAEKVPALVR